MFISTVEVPVPFVELSGDNLLHLVCGGDLSNSSRGELLSPGFPGSYCNNTNCTWTASFNATKQVTFRFNVFNTESSDYFRVHISDPLYGNGVVDLYEMSGLCSSDHECPHGAEISFLTTNLTVIFSADQSVSAMGFNISYSIRDLSESLSIY